MVIHGVKRSVIESKIRKKQERNRKKDNWIYAIRAKVIYERIKPQWRINHIFFVVSISRVSNPARYDVALFDGTSR